MASRGFNLESWLEASAANQARFEALGERSNFAEQPEGGGWSAAECVAHLHRTGEVFLPLWQEAMQKGQRKSGGGYAIWWRWFLKGIENPAKMRTKTPAAFVPPASMRMELVLEDYLRQRKAVEAIAREMAARDCGGLRIASPFAKWMSYPFDFSLDLWLAHERRHLEQAT